MSIDGAGQLILNISLSFWALNNRVVELRPLFPSSSGFSRSSSIISYMIISKKNVRGIVFAF